jgi:hypothetical protein
MFNQVRLGRRLGLVQVSLPPMGSTGVTMGHRLDRMLRESWMLKLVAAILLIEGERWIFNHKQTTLSHPQTCRSSFLKKARMEAYTPSKTNTATKSTLTTWIQMPNLQVRPTNKAFPSQSERRISTRKTIFLKRSLSRMKLKISEALNSATIWMASNIPRNTQTTKAIWSRKRDWTWLKTRWRWTGTLKAQHRKGKYIFEFFLRTFWKEC